MAIEYNFTLDMDRSKRDNNIAYARTGDIDSIVINADLVFNGAAYTPSGTNAFFECITPNGRSVRAAAEKIGSSVTVEVPSAAFQAAGVINVAYFRFETGDASNPTYVESTEPFAIVVREGIGDSIDAGDYIEEWRKLADHLEAVVADVEQKAEQAETAINEQKTEVDQLKAQAQKAIAGDVTDVEDAAQAAITAINKEKADVANAAEGITEAGEQAINEFNTNSQQAVDTFNLNSQQAVSKFNTDSASAISQFNTNGTSAIDQFNSKGTTAIDQFNTDADGKLGEVDDMITGAQGDVDAAITQLKTATDQAVDAMEDALDGTTAGSLQNAINRTLKLDVADMTDIPSNSSLSSFTNVGSYCCKTAAIAATVGDCPVDDSPFNMYVFSSATSGQVMQLVVPIDLNGKPTAEWHVRFGTSSAMDPWSVIGGGADIAAGLGIDVTGDTQKTVSLDTDTFYQHYGAANIIQGSTEVTGGGRVKELRVKGKTWVNRWPEFQETETRSGVTLTFDETGLFTLSGTATSFVRFAATPQGIGQNKDVVIQLSAPLGDGAVAVLFSGAATAITSASDTNLHKGNTGSFETITAAIQVTSGTTVNASFRVMLVDGTEAPDCFTPTASIASVETGKLVTSGKNLIDASSMTINKAVNPETGEIYATSITGNWYATETKIPCPPPGSSIVCSAGSSHRSSIAFYFGNGTFISGKTISKTEVAVVPDGASLMAIDVYKDYFANFQLELGSTATPYEPPTVTETPLPEVELRSLPNGTCDELVIKADGTCEVERKTVQVAFDGSEDEAWTLSAANRFAISLQKPALTKYNDEFLQCDSYSFIYGITKLSDKMCAVDGDGLVFAIEDSSFQDVASFRVALQQNPVAIVYASAQTIEPQSPVTLPALPAPTFNQYHDADIPSEIEAEVVKVDYLPVPDVYTREEVDQKIEAGSMPAIVPVSQGGTGVTTAAAERNRLGLGNTTGALPVANGGTGKTTAAAAQNALLGGINTLSTDASDETLFVGYYASPSDATGAVYKRSASTVWNWIASKIRSVFGFSSSNVLPVTNGGTGSTSAKAAQNSLLNDMNMSSDPLTDSSMLVGYNASPSASDGAVHRRSMTTIWDYVVGKIRSTFGFDSSNVLKVSNGGTGLTANPSILVNLESESTSNVLASSPRPGVTGTLPVSHGGTGATAPGVDMLSNLGITFGTAEPPLTGTPGSIYIQYFE